MAQDKKVRVYATVMIGSLLLLALFINASNTSPAQAQGAQVFRQGGNSFGEAAELGTNDNNPLVFRSNGINRMTIDSAGTIDVSNGLFQAYETLRTVQVNGTLISRPISDESSVVITASFLPTFTSNFIEWRNTDNSLLGSIGPTGNLKLGTNHTVAGCLVLADTDGVGFTYLTANDGVLTTSATKPADCQ